MNIADVIERLRGVGLLIQLFVKREPALKIFNRLSRIAQGGMGETDAGQKARQFRLTAKPFLNRQTLTVGVERLLMTLLHEINDARVHPGLGGLFLVAEFLRDQTQTNQEDERARIIGLGVSAVALTVEQQQQLAVDQFLIFRQQRLAFGVR